ncbi:PHP domain-containing protein [uncultured Ruthenibacterium sp.]|uniref:PHP domain-containing protein n=1 Tax=uncultured Ruthenibacterium sp. TaxID=1905347 RepID=UPI00349E9EC1
MPGDLHTHTNFSDGSSDIELLPVLAQRAGLTSLAVSDHDTELCIQYAQQHPVQCGVRLIPAVEMTGFDTERGRRVHMLCYCPDLTDGILNFFRLMKDRRNAVTSLSIDELEKLYPQFTRAAAKSFSKRSGVTYKTHLIRLLYEYGYTDGIYKDLYRELFGRGGKVLHDPAYEPIDTVLDLIHQARGVAVLAHPSVYKSMDLANELAREGRIDGVEIDHPRNTPEDREQLHRLADRWGLIVTGGTDFHGMHMSKPTPLGAYTTSDEMIERILNLAQKRKE